MTRWVINVSPTPGPQGLKLGANTAVFTTQYVTNVFELGVNTAVITFTRL
jgi:hypothetical protein